MLGGVRRPWQVRSVVLVARATARMAARPKSHGSSVVQSAPLPGGLIRRGVGVPGRPRSAASTHPLTLRRGYVDATDNRLIDALMLLFRMT